MNAFKDESDVKQQQQHEREFKDFFDAIYLKTPSLSN